MTRRESPPAPPGLFYLCTSFIFTRKNEERKKKKTTHERITRKMMQKKKQQRPFILFRVPRCVWCVPKVPTRLSDGGREYIIHALPNRTMVRVFHLFFSPFLLTNRKRKLSFFFAFFLEMDIFLHSSYFVEHLKNIDGLITCGFKDTFSK